MADHKCADVHGMMCGGLFSPPRRLQATSNPKARSVAAAQGVETKSWQLQNADHDQKAFMTKQNQKGGCGRAVCARAIGYGETTDKFQKNDQLTISTPHESTLFKELTIYFCLKNKIK